VNNAQLASDPPLIGGYGKHSPSPRRRLKRDVPQVRTYPEPQVKQQGIVLLTYINVPACRTTKMVGWWICCIIVFLPVSVFRTQTGVQQALSIVG
jgi:hypothetical protein